MAVYYSETVGTCPFSLTDDGVLTIGTAGTSTSFGWVGYSNHPIYKADAVKGYSAGSYTVAKMVKSVNIVGTVSIISGKYCDSLFREMTNLTTITGLANLDMTNSTLLQKIFYQCSSLTSLDIHTWNTSNVTNMSEMFYGCSSLTSLNLGNFNTSNVTNMFEMFYNCSSLTSLNLNSFNTSNVINMRSMFAYCKSLTSLNLSNFNTSNVTTMSSMFRNCSSLTSLNLSSFNTSSVIYMQSMFTSCSSLTALNLSSFNTFNVTDMSWMFQNCSSLTSLDLSSFNTSNITDMSQMFTSCSSLTSLDLSSFNTSNVTDMSWMFTSCSSLTSLNLSSFNTFNVTDMNLMFHLCYSLTSLNLSNFNTFNVTDMSDMFYNCSKISTLILGPHFTFDKVTSTDNMFKNVPTLKERTTNETLAVNCNPGEYIKKVTKTDITNAPTTISGIAESDLTSLFENNTTITEINLANLDLTYTKNFSKMFKGCSKLKRLVFNDTIKLSGNTTTDMFTGMTALYRIKPDGSREQLTTSVTDLAGVWSAVNAKPKFYNGGKIECNSYTEMPSSNTNPTRMYNIGTLYTITLKEDSTATKQSIAPTRVVTGKEIIEKYTY